MALLFAAIVTAIGSTAIAAPAYAEATTAAAMPATGAARTAVRLASSADCLYILNRSGYRTTPERARACNIGAGGGIDWATSS